MIPVVLVVLEISAGAILAWQSIAHLNRMTRATRATVAVAWVAIGGTAASVVANVVTASASADWRTAIVLTAVAVLSISDRRKHHP